MTRGGVKIRAGRLEGECAAAGRVVLGRGHEGRERPSLQRRTTKDEHELRHAHGRERGDGSEGDTGLDV